jgi:hypothetical protein
MHKRTDLADGLINGSDRILVELIEPLDKPAFVAITWPLQPTVVSTERFPDTAVAVAQLFARAHIVLAALKAHGQ